MHLFEDVGAGCNISWICHRSLFREKHCLQDKKTTVWGTRSSRNVTFHKTTVLAANTECVTFVFCLWTGDQLYNKDQTRQQEAVSQNWSLTNKQLDPWSLVKLSSLFARKTNSGEFTGVPNHFSEHQTNCCWCLELQSGLTTTCDIFSLYCKYGAILLRLQTNALLQRVAWAARCADQRSFLSCLFQLR